MTGVKIMNTKIKRAIISVIVFVVIYFLAGFIIRWSNYDMYLEALKVFHKIRHVSGGRRKKLLSRNIISIFELTL